MAASFQLPGSLEHPPTPGRCWSELYRVRTNPHTRSSVRQPRSNVSAASLETAYLLWGPKSEMYALGRVSPTSGPHKVPGGAGKCFRSIPCDRLTRVNERQPQVNGRAQIREARQTLRLLHSGL